MLTRTESKASRIRSACGASVLIDNSKPGIANLSAKRVAQDDELHQRENHGRQHQRR